MDHKHTTGRNRISRPEHGYTWRVGSWEDVADHARTVRRQVFGTELRISEAIDFDGTDRDALHAVGFEQNRPVATGRLQILERRIGRMAVLADYRGRTIGSHLLELLLRECVRFQIATVTLHAQAPAVGFYERHGFASRGVRFTEAGIVHQAMHKQLMWQKAVAGVLVRAGKVHLGLRASHLTMGDHWDFFGGKVEPGETDEGALVRELDEELGIRAKPGRCFGVLLYDGLHGNPWWRCPVYIVSSWSGAMRLNEEHQRSGWFTPKELAGLRLSHRRIVELANLAVNMLA